MIPLAVTARLSGGISMPGGGIALDALLAAAVAVRDGLPPASVAGVLPIEIPVQREPGGRFHLASWSVSAWEEHELRWLNRRFPLAEAQGLAAPSLRRIHIATGPCKSFRLPLETGHLVDDQLRWWCVGEDAAIRDLLGLVSHLGKRRAVGAGRVRDWTVAPCEPWGDGFPVVRDGRALRPLPADWPGLVSPDVGYGCLTYPYWRRSDEEMCALPELGRG